MPLSVRLVSAEGSAEGKPPISWPMESVKVVNTVEVDRPASDAVKVLQAVYCEQNPPELLYCKQVKEQAVDASANDCILGWLSSGIMSPVTPAFRTLTLVRAVSADTVAGMEPLRPLLLSRFKDVSDVKLPKDAGKEPCRPNPPRLSATTLVVPARHVTP